MNSGVNSDSLPIDLINEILSRLPAKSTVRFRGVSKRWGSMLHRPYFTDLFYTMSRARPRILFVLKRDEEWSFYSSPQPQSPYDKSSLAVSADFQMKFPQSMNPDVHSFTSGLIHIPTVSLTKKEDTVHVICNPSTGRYVILPNLGKSISFLGFDPISKQYKVLFMNYPSCDDDDDDSRILTLGPGIMKWRKIQCPLTHYPRHKGICINGILYYLGQQPIVQFSVTVCFDVRFEKFKFIETPFCCDSCTKLVNYKGKLGVIQDFPDIPYDMKLRMWVLEDVEKEEWSTYVHTLPVKHDNVYDRHRLLVAGVTPTGEIVLSMGYRYKAPYYVYYFSPERNTLHTVKIQGFETNVEEYHFVHVFIDHVEDLKFDFMKTAYAPISINPLLKPKPRRSTSTSTSSKQDHHQKQERPTFKSINNFDALCLLDDDDDE